MLLSLDWFDDELGYLTFSKTNLEFRGSIDCFELDFLELEKEKSYPTELCESSF